MKQFIFALSWMLLFLGCSDPVKDLVLPKVVSFATSATAQSVSAGRDYTQYLPTNERRIIAHPTGFTPTTWAWTKVSGPTCTIVDANKQACMVRGIVTAGTYVFRVTANGTYQDDMTLTILDAPNGNTNPIIYSTDWETGNIVRTNNPFTGWLSWNETNYTTISSFAVNGTNVYSGAYSAEYILNRAVPPAGGSLGIRSENLWNGTGTGQKDVSPNYTYIRFKLINWTAEGAPESNPFQHHDQNDYGDEGWAPPQAPWIRNGRWWANIGFDTTLGTSYPSISKIPAPGSNSEGLFDMGPVVSDQWTEMLWYSNFSPSDTGRVKVWINKNLVLDYTGPCWYKDFAVVPLPYVKVGIYKWPWGSSWQDAWGQRIVSQRKMYVDEVKFGNRLATPQDFGISGTGSGSPSNVPPVANAGADTTITAPQNWAYLRGNGSLDTDGTIASYLWEFVSGPSTAGITNPTQASTTGFSLIPGTYVFRLTVTDDDGATSTDTKSVIVNAAAANVAPVANAGADIKILEGQTSVALSGGGTDSDGTIATYAWSLVSGYPLTISNPAIASPTVSNLTVGIYQMRLTVVDDDGAAGTDDMYIEVVRKKLPRKRPTAF